MDVEHLNQIGKGEEGSGKDSEGSDLLAEPYRMLWIHQEKESRKGGQGNGKEAGVQLEQR